MPDKTDRAKKKIADTPDQQSPNHKIEFSGHCLCGSVTFEGSVSADSAIAVHCHCKDCQRATGSGFATVIAIPEEDLTISGTYASHRVVGESGGAVDREFCPQCGSPMFTTALLSQGLRFVKAGVLNDSSWVKPAMACWTDSREDWCMLSDSLESVAQNPVITNS